MRTGKRKTALVVEGGGMRGIYTAGILDAFLTANFDPFDLYIGVSAGACNLSSHIAGQFQRNYRLYTNFMTSRNFISFGKCLRGGHWFDLDWLWDTFSVDDPLDTKRAAANLKAGGKEFLIAVTDAETGLPVYLKPDADSMLQELKASCSLPVLYRGFVEIGGKKLTDGGVTDSLPVIAAANRGAERIVILRTQRSDYRKKGGMDNLMASLFLRDYPALRKAVRERPVNYMNAVGFIHNPPSGLEIIEVAPPKGMHTGRTTQSLRALRADYQKGIDAGLDLAAGWQV